MLDLLFDVMALIRKETLMIFKDKIECLTLVAPIFVQAILFGYVATYDLNKIDYALLDQDHSQASIELTWHFDGSGFFNRVAGLNSESEIAPILDEKKALMVLHIGPDFERSLNFGQTAYIQLAADGRNSNVAGTAIGYAADVIEAYNHMKLGELGSQAGTVSVSSRAWFNPNLETRWNMMSGLIVILAVVQVIVLAGQSVAREKEQGTFDQLLVTPFGPMRIMLGKALPPVLIGVGQSTIILLIAIHWFYIPFKGSFGLLYIGLFIFNCSIVGVGLCISALTSTMQQAMLFSFALIFPMILLSGFVTPVASMPQVLQAATLLNPVRYGVEFAQRIYLEGARLQEMRLVFAPLTVIAVVTLSTAAKLFRGTGQKST